MAASYGEIKPYNPSIWDSWSEKTNFFAKFSYDLVDGVSVTAQSFLRGPNTQHLNGTQVSGNDRMDGFVNTVEWGIAIGEATTFRTIENGVFSPRWGRYQAHSHYMSPLKNTAPQGFSPYHFHIGGNKHIIPNPSYWPFYYDWKWIWW